MTERERDKNRLRRNTTKCLFVGGAAAIAIGTGVIIGSVGIKALGKEASEISPARAISFYAGTLVGAVGILAMSGSTVLVSFPQKRRN